MLVENGYPTFHTIDLIQQLLVTADGATHQADGNAMRIERQPDNVELGAHDRLEFDLLHDIPQQAAPRSLRLYGAPVNDLGGSLHRDPGVEIPLG